MSSVTRIAQAAIGIALASTVAACGHVQARTPAPTPALDTPPAPGHFVIPFRVEAPPEPPATEPAAQPAAQPPSRTRETPPPATRPPDKPTPPAAGATGTQAETPVLQTTPNVDELEGKVKALLTSANRDLGKINYASLDANAREQYNTAKRFVEMAQEAVKNRNLVLAHQFADSAAGLASQLVKNPAA
jgi:hypothetical protein